MRPRLWIGMAILASALVGGVAGAQVGRMGKTKLGAERPLVEGPILTLLYVGPNGQPTGLPPDPHAVAEILANDDDTPDRYGRLYKDVLIVSNPRQKDYGVRVIPTLRILQLTFADE